MLELNIVDLIQTNPITRLTNTYQNKLLCKIKDAFSNEQQQLFVSSFYCFLNYNQNTDFIINLDNIWQWLGFNQKYNAKYLLQKQFIMDTDYKIFAPEDSGTKNDKGRGGHNKENIMLTIKTFKSLCLKAGTKTAYQIHDYYLKLEEMLYEVLEEESNELKLQLENKNIEIQNAEKGKEIIREKTLLEQFSTNTQCVYYGIIDNINDKNEKLIKFGNSNNLKARVLKHRNTYLNFRLVNAFKVDNKVQIENAIKNNTFFNERVRTITIKSIKHIELLTMDGISFSEIDKNIKEIISSIEYSAKNYIKILEENKLLKQQLENKRETIDANSLILLTSENKRLHTENAKLITKYNTLKRKTGFVEPNGCVDLITVKDTDNNINVEEKQHSYDNINNIFKRIAKNKDGKYNIDGISYDTLFGTRTDVWNGKSYKTSGGLTKNDLMMNDHGKIISKKKHIYEVTNNRFIKCGINNPH